MQTTSDWGTHSGQVQEGFPPIHSRERNGGKPWKQLRPPLMSKFNRRKQDENHDAGRRCHRVLQWYLKSLHSSNSSNASTPS